MRIHSLLFIFLFVASTAELAQAQTEQAVRRAAQGKNVNQEELVSFNADVPYNQFVIEHLAGDLLTEPRRLGPRYFRHNPRFITFFALQLLGLRGRL